MSGIGPGSLVVCVDDGPAIEPQYAWHIALLKSGRVYRVAYLTRAPRGSIGLALAGLPLNQYGLGFTPRRFRPLNDDAEDTALVARIKACKPNRVKA